MKFLTLEGGQLGALIDATVVDIPAAAEALSAICPAETLQALVEAGDGEAERAWALALRAREQGVAVRAFADVKPGAPLPKPRRNILCLGKNYLDHAREIAKKMDVSGDAPSQPIIFTKATTAVLNRGQTPITATDYFLRGRSIGHSSACCSSKKRIEGPEKQFPLILERILL